MKKTVLLVSIILSAVFTKAQLPNPVLVGYWHNWSDVNAPYIPLDLVDNRYNVLAVSFAVPTSTNDMTMLFTPDGISSNQFINQIQTVQSQGRKVILSIGGATTSIDLTTTINKNAFVNSMTNIINTYGFDGIDIDIEHGNSIQASGGTIASPTSPAQINLIDAIKQIMANYRTTHAAKLILTMAPETAYVQGGQSAYGGIWGGYLPIIDELRDSLDLLHVQLYNSGSMYGIDGAIYTQGTSDFIVAMTEAVLHGFNTSGGYFNGLTADKVAVGLPACVNAAGGGYADTAAVRTAINYIRGFGPPAGNYLLTNVNGYPMLRGMMTWSVNWDAVNTCASAWEYAHNYQSIFATSTTLPENSSNTNIIVFPNPSTGNLQLSNYQPNSKIEITNTQGEIILKCESEKLSNGIRLNRKGIYYLKIISSSDIVIKKIIVE